MPVRTSNKVHTMPASADLFDDHGTLLGAYSVARCAESWFPGSGERLAALWREKQIEYTRLVTLGRLRNADPTMWQALVRHAGFDSLLQHGHSVDSVSRFKTHPAAYALGLPLELPGTAPSFTGRSLADAPAHVPPH
jgi:hypothetical protein